jgi:hypothetical protein
MAPVWRRRLERNPGICDRQQCPAYPAYKLRQGLLTAQVLPVRVAAQQFHGPAHGGTALQHVAQHRH